MTENLNQLREKQLRGVKYDYIRCIIVNFDYLLFIIYYLLVNIMVVHY
jgi:hypothetical protein